MSQLDTLVCLTQFDGTLVQYYLKHCSATLVLIIILLQSRPPDQPNAGLDLEVGLLGPDKLIRSQNAHTFDKKTRLQTFSRVVSKVE